jgi:Uncharacterised nucleotidyltransferase
MEAPTASIPRRTITDLSPEEQLALTLLRSPADGGPDGVPDLAERADPAAVGDRLARLRVLGLLGSRLRERAPAAVPPELAQRIEAEIATARRLGGVQQMVAESVLSRLAAAGIAAAPLKGAPLAAAVHGDVGLRVAGDVDILVALPQLRDAVGLVESMGWQAPHDWTDRAGRPLLHFALAHPHGLPAVELHWRVHFYEGAFAGAALERAVPAGAGLRLADADTLTCLALFYARDGLTGVRLAADAITLWERMGRPDRPLAAAHSAHPPLRPALAAAAVALARVAGEPDDRFAGPVTPSPGTRRALALADPLLRMDAQQRQADIALIDLLLAPAGERRAAFERQLVPPTGLLRQHSAELAEAGPARLARARAEHPARFLRRFALAATRRRQRPSALPPTV